jgi:hypothetical protein
MRPALRLGRKPRASRTCRPAVIPEEEVGTDMSTLLTEADVAERLQVSLASVRRWRLEKRGPIFVKVGSLVRYRPDDLESWVVGLPASDFRQPNGKQASTAERAVGDTGRVGSEPLSSSRNAFSVR